MATGRSGATTRAGAIIAGVVAVAALLFLYVAGWFTPDRLSPERFVAALSPPGGAALGHRRNHAKGVCVTGTFTSTGAARALSTAPMLAVAGVFPLIGRFSLGSPVPTASDGTTRVRGFGFLIRAPDGSEWRSANIDVPFFPVATPAAFLDLLQAGGAKDPNAMAGVAARHPELKRFGAWAASAPWTGSFTEERYNGLDAFRMTDAIGHVRAVRWSLIPTATPVDVPADDLKTRENFLEGDLRSRIASGPQRWTMVLTAAAAGDPTDDPSHAWPADRQTVAAGTLALSRAEPEADGPCRDVNFDPTILPPGIATGDDPFPAARSAVYAVSFNRRTAEAADYPRRPGGPQP